MPAENDLSLMKLLHERHRIHLPLSHLHAHSPEEQHAIDKLKVAQQENSARALYLLQSLISLLRLFGEKKVWALPLKGPVLAQELYGDPGMRSSIDLDFLIRGDDFQRALGILKDQGFKLINPQRCSSTRQWQRYFAYKKDVRLRRDSDALLVEMHLDLYYPDLYARTKAPLLWEHTLERPFHGQVIQVMDSHQELLYLAIHGASHQYFRLFWLRDFAVALKQWQLDHQSVLELAERIGTVRLLLLSLKLSQDFYGTGIPGEYEMPLRKDRKVLQKLCRWSHRRILGNEKLGWRAKVERHLFFLSLRRGMSYKVRYVWNIYMRWHIRRFLGGHS